MTIVLIAITPRRGELQQFPPEVNLMAGCGIAGDRHFNPSPEYPGQNLSLVEAEAIEAFNRDHGAALGLADTRRNLVTRGVRLNQLVGKEFTIGTVRLKGVALCDPCEGLGSRLATADLSPPDTVAAWVGKGGLLADVLSDGCIRLGDGIVLPGGVGGDAGGEVGSEVGSEG